MKMDRCSESHTSYSDHENFNPIRTASRPAHEASEHMKEIDKMRSFRPLRLKQALYLLHLFSTSICFVDSFSLLFLLADRKNSQSCFLIVAGQYGTDLVKLYLCWCSMLITPSNNSVRGVYGQFSFAR